MRNYSFNKPHRPAKAYSLRGDGGAGRHISRSAAGTSRNGPRQNAYTFFHVFVRGNGLPAVSPLLFALIILTFFLPFVTVSCGQYELETVRLVDFQRAELVEEGEFGGLNGRPAPGDPGPARPAPGLVEGWPWAPLGCPCGRRRAGAAHCPSGCHQPFPGGTKRRHGAGRGDQRHFPFRFLSLIFSLPGRPWS